jgi:RNA polymerase sigma-70 factor (ECF subfamily)
MKTQAREFSRSEAFLVARAHQGCRQSIEELIERNYQRMYRTALRIVRNQSDAEDVVQDVVVILLRKLGDFRGQSALSTWLTTITMNAAINSLRKQKKRPASIEQVHEDHPGELQAALAHGNPVASPEDLFAEVQTRTILADGLATLPAHYRVPLELRLSEDLSVEEISDRLNVPVGTIKVQLFRGRKAIKQQIAPRLRPAA